MIKSLMTVRFLERLLFCGLPFCLMTSLIFGGWSFWPEIFSQYRLFFLLFAPIIVFLLYYYYRHPDKAPIFSERQEKTIFWLISLFYLLTYIKVSLFNYYAFKVPGIDFSVLDHLIPLTALGKFMMHPVLEVNIFGIHSIPIYFLLYPFHRFFSSPLFFLVLQPIILWSAVFPLYALMRHFWNKFDPIPRLVFLLAFLNFYQVSQVLRYNFHFEVFYIPLFLYLFYFMEKRNYKGSITTFVLLLMIKEDAGLYLLFTAFAYWIVFKRKYAAILIGLSSASIFLLNTQLIIPKLRESSFELVAMINKYGKSYPEIIKNFIFHPFSVLIDVIKGGWVKITVPLLFTPILSLFFLISMSGFILITSTSTYLDIRTLAIHYSSPYLPYVFFGAILTLKRFHKKYIFISSLLCLVFGGGFISFPKINFQDIRHFNDISKKINLVQGSNICIQGILMPHFNHEKLLQKKFYTDKCFKNLENFYLFNHNFDTYPHSKEQIIEAISLLKNKHHYQETKSGNFILLTK